MQKGFTLIEFMIAVVIIAIIGSVVMRYNSDGVRCVGGYEFAVGYKWSTGAQILDAQGHGITCK